MNLPAWLRIRISESVPAPHFRDEVEDEIRSHIQHRADDLERSGMDRGLAERRARIEFGGREKFKEEIHETIPGNFLGTFIKDARYAVRVLLKSPGFTIVAVLTLALAIGANAVVFAVLNGLFLRPLNVPDGQSLYAIQRGNDNYIIQSYPDYLDLRDRNRSFDALAAYTSCKAASTPARIQPRFSVYGVSGNYFNALGIQPYLGRLIQPSDERGLKSAPYIVLSYAYWHGQFPG